MINDKMELDGFTASAPSYITNLNEIKQEVPESHHVHLESFQHEMLTIKSEPVSTEDEFKPASLKTLDPEVSSNLSFELKSETLAQDCWIGSDENICIKKELLHEDLNIKSEDEAIPETLLDDKHNVVNQFDEHMKLSSLEKPFKCNICGKDYGTKGTLKNHLLIHSGEKPFKCEICHHSFAAKGRLQRHVNTTHVGDKPFKCNICDRDFGEKKTLTDHLRTHTGEKPFKCNVCDRDFGKRSTLKNHLRTHTKEKPFKCNVCDHSFARKDYLHHHLKIIHAYY